MSILMQRSAIFIMERMKFRTEVHHTDIHLIQTALMGYTELFGLTYRDIPVLVFIPGELMHVLDPDHHMRLWAASAQQMKP
ncbi:hypothetical protein CJP72_23755 [Citrobacter sp. NCU1]|nr:hypothetical protein [Citrobacter sp. NCU1]